jgi:pimeloyl-ACP methyl ester carboxylesterase
MKPELHAAIIGGCPLRSVDVGSGPAVVLIHGLAGDRQAWREPFEWLAPARAAQASWSLAAQLFAPQNAASGLPACEPTDRFVGGRR